MAFEIYSIHNDSSEVRASKASSEWATYNIYMRQTALSQSCDPVCKLLKDLLLLILRIMNIQLMLCHDLAIAVCRSYVRDGLLYPRPNLL